MKKVLRFLTLAVLLAAPWGGYFNQVQAQQSLPYNYGFEDNNLATDGWTTSNTSGLNDSEFGIHTSAYKTGSYGFRFSSYNDNGECTQYLISPELSAATGVVVQFYYKASSSYGEETFKVGYSTTDASPSSFTFGSEISTSNTSWTLSEEFNFPAGTKYVAIYYYSDYQYRLYVDDITFTAPASCAKPTGLEAALTMGNGSIASLTWTKGGTEDAWVLEYSTASDFTGATSVDLDFTDNLDGTVTADLTGLTAEQTYYAHVKANCGGGDMSEWSTICTFTPTNAYNITVNDGTTTNEYVPIYGYYCDNLTRSQFIIPATSLTAMQWGTINELTFYASNTSVDWGSAEFEVYVMETDETTLDALVDWTDMTKVMTAGSLSITGNQMVVTLTTPYHYQDGNLMIGFKQTVEDEDVHSYWYGVSVDGASMGGYEGTYSTSITQRNFLPKTTFSYTPGAAPTCAKPTGLTYSDVTAHGVQLSWTDNNGGSVDQWQICLNGDEDHLVLVNANPYIFTTELEQDHDYAIKVRAYCAADEQSSWSNTVNFHTLVACAAPTALDVDNITAHTAELSWTSSADNFNIKYRTAADVNFNVGDFTQVGTNYTAQDELTPYLIDLSAYSGTGNIAIRHYNCTDNFYLNVDDIVLTNAGGTEILNENFESGSIPSSWIIIDNDADGYYWLIRHSTAQDTYGNDVCNGNYCATSASYEGSALNPDNWLIIPNVELGGTLTFVARGQDPDWPDEVFGVYVSTNVVATPAGAWQNTTSTTNGKDLDGLSSLTTYEWQVQADCGGETSAWASGTFTTLASCFPVTDLDVDDITANTITLSWTDHNSGNATYVVTNTSDEAYTVTGLTATGCTVTNLDGNTSYTFKVKANCGVEGVSTAETITERTACAPIATLPYNEGFESAEEGFYCWDFNYFYRQYNTSYTHGGNTSIYSGSDNSYVVAPEMDEEISNLMLNFWWSNFDADKDYGTLHIGYVTDINDPATSFVDLYTIDMSTCNAAYVQSDNYVFTGAPAGARMALKYTQGANGAKLYIDDVTIDERPACTTPISLTITGGTVTAHGATLTWTSEASAWQVQYRENGESTWLPNTPEGVTSATKIFTDLDPETSYDVRVRTDCGSSVYSDWVTLANAFTTLVACPAPTGLAVGSITNHTAQVSWTNSGTDNYNVRYRTSANITGGTPETFATSSTPTGWNRYTGLLSEVMGGTALTTSSNWSFSNYYVFPGDYHAKLNIYGTTCKYWLVTPETTLGSNAALGFDLALTDYNSSSAIEFPNGQADDRFVVLITTDDMVTWTILREWNNSGSSYVYNNIAPAGQNVVIDLSAYNGETVKIAFYGESTVAVTGEDNDLHIDNVNIGTFEDAGSWTLTTATTNSKTLTDLDAETQYDVQVQDVCGGIDGESTWSATTFTTDIPCAAPTGLAYAELKATQVDLSWNSSASDWQICVNGDEANPIDIDMGDVDEDNGTITYTLTGLTAETPYTVKVRNNCEASYTGDGYSEYTTTVDFTTLAACAQPTGVTASDITNTTATISWTGDSKFTLRYREADIDGTPETFATSSIPTNWTRYSGLLSEVMGGTALTTSSSWSFTNSYVFPGDYHAKLNIYGTSCKHWLVTPETTLGSDEALSFDLALTDYGSSSAIEFPNGQADDRFVVLITTDNMATWTILREWNNSGSSYVYNNIAPAGQNVSIDLSAYDGETVKIAFYGESTVSVTGEDNDLHIDNVVFGAIVPASPWTSVDVNTATSEEIALLTPETKYEVQVEALCGDPHPVSDLYFFTTLAGITKNITANEWYAISSPVHNSGNNETFAGVTNLTSGTYDLMYWDQANGTWKTSKPAVITSFTRGQGYIYRRSATTTLTFVGQRNSGDFNSDYLYYSCPDLNLKGFHLVGNPYPVAYTPTVDYYKLSTNGTWTANTASTGSVAVAEGFFIKKASSGSYAFAEPSGAKSAPRSNAATIALTVSNDDYSDVAYARFADGEGMPKMAHLNTEAPALSIPQGDRRYAIANLDENTESFPLHFSGFGEYTFSLSDNSLGLGYLHLVDRETGADVDMLRQSGYTFNANGNESERFVVLLRPTADANSFVRVSDSRLVIDGSGLLQVFDVMGRQLGSAQVDGTTTLDRRSLGIVGAGVYVLRLNGNSQKIVVK